MNMGKNISETGHFKEIDAIVWTRRSDNWEGYMIVKRRGYYDVLLEDDGFWGREGSFSTEKEAKTFIIEKTERSVDTAMANRKEPNGLDVMADDS
jgi:hypothetical protein